MFDTSDGIEISLTAGLPPGLEASLDILDRNDSNTDFDFAEEEPADAQVPLNETCAQVLPGKTVKAYLVKDTAYRTFVCDS